jgi:eukaryotic-like serine/threonine-protein kinase
MEEAIYFYTKAALAAQTGCAHDEAIVCLDRALALSSAIPHRTEDTTNLYELLGDSLAVKGEFDASRQNFNRCLERLSDRDYLKQAEILNKICLTYLTQRRLTEYDEIFETALERLGPFMESHDESWLKVWLDMHLSRLETFYFRGENERLKNLLKEVYPILERVGSPRQFVKYYLGEGYFTNRQERFCLTEKSIRIGEKVLQASLEWGDQAAIAYAVLGMGFNHLFSGHLEKGEKYLVSGLSMTEEIGVPMIRCLFLIYLTHLFRLRGDVNNVRKYALLSLEASQQLEVYTYSAFANAQLAWLDWRDQKLNEAEQKAKKAIEIWKSYDNPFAWTAHWVLYDNYLSQDRLAEVVEAAMAMLKPNQQCLDNRITTLLHNGIKSWEVGDLTAACEGLHKALDLAKESGYL